MVPESLANDTPGEPLELWCAYPDDLLEERASTACMALLTEEERKRWQRYRFERNRREFLATRALVRTVLSRHRPVNPEGWRFKVNAHGKPETEPACGVSFNLSNALGMVVCLVAQGAEVGVDVEAVSRGAEIVPLAPDVFSAQEQAQLRALPAQVQPERALRLWTLKESYIKARGLGLALPLGKFSFVFEDGGTIRLEIDPELGDLSGRWRFTMLEHAGHRVALMAAVATEPKLTVWEWRPGELGEPREAGAAIGGWFPAGMGW